MTDKDDRGLTSNTTAIVLVVLLLLGLPCIGAILIAFVSGFILIRRASDQPPPIVQPLPPPIVQPLPPPIVQPLPPPVEDVPQPAPSEPAPSEK